MIAPDSFPGVWFLSLCSEQSQFSINRKGWKHPAEVFSNSKNMANEHERTVQDERPIKNNLTAVGRDD